METKKEIRKTMQKKRNGLSAQKREDYSRKINEILLAHPLFWRAGEVYCYAPCKTEVSVRELVENCWKTGKKTAFPRVTGERSMEFFYIDGWDGLKPGYRGILEPQPQYPVSGDPALILVPGLAFDGRGNRLGYGGGFYDAYLHSHRGHKTIALAFSVQCLSLLPTEPCDMRVGGVLTEKGWFYDADKTG